VKGDLHPRKARAKQQCKDAWFYVNANSLDITAQVVTVAGSYFPEIRLTRRQVVAALAAMDRLAHQTGEKQR